MSFFSKKNSRSGITLIEILTAAGIALTCFLLASQVMRKVSNDVKGTSEMAAIMAEHTALNALVSSIPLSMAHSVFKENDKYELRHPFCKYQKFKDGSDACIPDRNWGVPVNSSKLFFWDQLSDAYFQFAWGGPSGGVLSSGLNSADYQSLVYPKLFSAGCLDCHGATPTSAATRNFSSFSSISSDPSLVSPLGFGTALGRVLLKPHMEFKSFRDPGRLFVTHQLDFESQKKELATGTTPLAEFGCLAADIFSSSIGGCYAVRNLTCPIKDSRKGTAVSANCYCTSWSSGKKGVGSCTGYTTYYTCVYHKKDLNKVCTHGLYKDPSLVFDNNLCKKRYKTGTWYSKWDCVQPNSEYATKQYRWEVTYKLESSWTTLNDRLPRKMVSTGALK